MTSFGFFFCIVGLSLLILERLGTLLMYWISKLGYNTVGKVVRYESRIARLAQWTTLDHPVVEYLDEDSEPKSGYVKYANSIKLPFEIGQEIEIIVMPSFIYYRWAMTSKRFRTFCVILMSLGIVIEFYY